MKKFAMLIAVFALFAAACQSNTTIESVTDGGASTADTAQADENDAEPELEETEPTAAPETAPADSAEDAADDADDAADDAAESAEDAADGAAADADDAADDATESAEDVADEPEVEPALDVSATIQSVLDADDWCEAARVVEDSSDVLEDVDFSDPAAVEQGITQTLAVMTAAQRVAPAEIAGDVEQAIGGFTVIADELEAVNWSFLDLDLSVITVLDGPMSLANYNIELYGFTECGIGTDPGAPPAILEDGTVEGDALTGDETFQLEGTVREQAVQGLVEAGFTEAEASCILADLDLSNPTALSDPAMMLAVFTDCGISLDRLAQIGG